MFVLSEEDHEDAANEQQCEEENACSGSDHRRVGDLIVRVNRLGWLMGVCGPLIGGRGGGRSQTESICLLSLVMVPRA